MAALLALAVAVQLVATAGLAQQRVQVELEVEKPKPAKPDGTTAVEVAVPATSVRELIQKGHLDEALLLIEQQLELNASDDELRVQRARLLYWKGRWPQALEQAEMVLQRHPADIEVLELVGQIRLAMGDLSKALECFMGMQAVGDNRPQVHQRVIDLLLRMEDLLGLEVALARGGQLSDEQEHQLAKIKHPWSVDAVAGLTLYNSNQWPRIEVSGGRRISSQWTLVGGGLVEQRTQGGVGKVAWSPKLELYANSGRFASMVHLSGSPSRAFLPQVDARADLSVAVLPIFGLGLWLRFARYASIDAAPLSSLTIGPHVPIHVGRLTVTPGYIGVVLMPGDIANSLMLRLRFQVTASQAWFAWFYAGDDPNFIDRQSAKPARGLTALVGLEHWFSGRVGLRASVTRIEPFGNFHPFTEFSLGLRSRL
ncbi:MAG: hypothetical protein EXR77_04990 [Myxococcales bacterium]|nr:hypothetical protein [Myxococcales bacterium]